MSFNITDLPKIVEQIRKAVSVVNLYTCTSPDGVVVEALTGVARVLRDNHGYELASPRKLCRIEWDGEAYYLDSFRFSHTIEQALTGTSSQVAPKEKE